MNGAGLAQLWHPIKYKVMKHSTCCKVFVRRSQATEPDRHNSFAITTGGRLAGEQNLGFGVGGEGSVFFHFLLFKLI